MSNKEKKINNKNEKKKKKKSGILKKVLIILLLILIALVGFIAYRTQKNGGGMQGLLSTLVGHDENTLKDLDTLQVLLMGVSTDNGLKLTDTIIVASYDPKTQKASLLSIPRDTFVGTNIKTGGGNDKINSLYQRGGAQKTIDAAIYGWDAIPALETAFENAIKRGVVLRIVYDETTRGSSYYPDTKKLAALSSASNNDKNIDSASTNFIMHNKFLVIDGKEVITGSMNYSQTGLSGFNSNNLIVIKSKEIAGLYAEEFNQMLAGKFHTAKVKSSQPRSYILGRSKVSVYFSPQDRVITSRIIPLVNNSKKYVYVPAFLITHEGLSQALINAKKRGVDIKICSFSVIEPFVS